MVAFGAVSEVKAVAEHVDDGSESEAVDWRRDDEFVMDKKGRNGKWDREDGRRRRWRMVVGHGKCRHLNCAIDVSAAELEIAAMRFISAHPSHIDDRCVSAAAPLQSRTEPHATTAYRFICSPQPEDYNPPHLAAPSAAVATLATRAAAVATLTTRAAAVATLATRAVATLTTA